MTFSIITICYNEEKRIRQTLKSVYTQDFADYEHIIEDGASTDKTLEIISDCARFYSEGCMRVYSEKDDGLYDAMNRAVARARGEYICFINSGDFLFDRNTLKSVATWLKKQPGMDWYYGRGIVIFPNGDEYFQIPGSFENVEGKDIVERLKSEKLDLLHQAIFAHRDCFVQNLFDTGYSLRAELKWYYKCLLAGSRVKRLDFPVCRYSVGGLSERAASVAVHAEETRRILEELHLFDEKKHPMLPLETNFAECHKNIYSQWLALHQAGRYVSDYLGKKGIRRIAVYGYAELGNHLINELKGTGVEISCVIDRQDKYPYSGIKVVKPEDFEGDADLVIVTPLTYTEEIKKAVTQKSGCPAAALEDVLEDMWNEEQVKCMPDVWKR